MNKNQCFSCDYWVDEDEWVMAWDIDYGRFPVCLDCMKQHNYYTAGV